jgi:hypothetical protein
VEEKELVVEEVKIEEPRNYPVPALQIIEI